MAGRKFKSATGVKIEAWETCIRVDGAAQTFSIGNHYKDSQAIQMVDAIYYAVYEKAVAQAKRDVVTKFAKLASLALK